MLGLPFAAFVFPIVTLITPCVLLYANWQANKILAKKKAESAIIISGTFNFSHLLEEKFTSDQSDGLKRWMNSVGSVDAWQLNNNRDKISVVALSIISALELIASVSFSAYPQFLPLLFFTTTMTVWLPIGIGILLAVSMLAACVYLQKNHEKQLGVEDSPYQIDYSCKAAAQSGNASSHVVVNNKLVRTPIAPAPTVVDSKVEATHIF